MQAIATGIGALPFSQQLRDATAGAHEAAEHSPFVEQLLGGHLAVDDYALLVAQLHAVYSVLEEAAAASTDPVAAPFLRPELTRAPALSADLEHLLGSDWRARTTTVPATQAYCERLRSSCFASSEGLVAHHYVRYLGDLSGGQILGRIIRRVYDLPDERGTSAYQFDEIASPKRFKDDYRALLDAAPWGIAERTRLIDEAIVAFECNAAVFDDLSARR